MYISILLDPAPIIHIQLRTGCLHRGVAVPRDGPAVLPLLQVLRVGRALGQRVLLRPHDDVIAVHFEADGPAAALSVPIQVVLLLDGALAYK